MTFANVVSVIALFVALGGGAYAVQVAAKNSVTTQSIRNGTVRSADIGTGQVKAADIKRGLLRDTTVGKNTRTRSICTRRSRISCSASVPK